MVGGPVIVISRRQFETFLTHIAMRGGICISYFGSCHAASVMYIF